MLTSKERKTTIFFFFYRKIYVKMFRSQILLNLICIIRRKSQCKYFIKITPMEHRIENIRTMSKLSTWKTTRNAYAVATPSTRSYYFLIHVKNDPLVDMSSKLQKSYFGMLGGFLLALCCLSVQSSTVCSREYL